MSFLSKDSLSTVFTYLQASELLPLKHVSRDFANYVDAFIQSVSLTSSLELDLNRVALRKLYGLFSACSTPAQLEVLKHMLQRVLGRVRRLSLECSRHVLHNTIDSDSNAEPLFAQDDMLSDDDSGEEYNYNGSDLMDVDELDSELVIYEDLEDATLKNKHNMRLLRNNHLPELEDTTISTHFYDNRSVLAFQDSAEFWDFLASCFDMSNIYYLRYYGIWHTAAEYSFVGGTKTFLSMSEEIAEYEQKFMVPHFMRKLTGLREVQMCSFPSQYEEDLRLLMSSNSTTLVKLDVGILPSDLCEAVMPILMAKEFTMSCLKSFRINGASWDCEEKPVFSSIGEVCPVLEELLLGTHFSETDPDNMVASFDAQIDGFSGADFLEWVQTKGFSSLKSLSLGYILMDAEETCYPEALGKMTSLEELFVSDYACNSLSALNALAKKPGHRLRHWGLQLHTGLCWDSDKQQVLEYFQALMQVLQMHRGVCVYIFNWEFAKDLFKTAIKNSTLQERNFLSVLLKTLFP